ncbi:hypothetical protein ACTG9Q_15765 [Actinokineospora sp. 24-640]
MTAIRSTRGRFQDLYTEAPVVTPPTRREVELARRAVTRAALNDDDRAMLLAALGLSDAGEAADGGQREAPEDRSCA